MLLRNASNDILFAFLRKIKNKRVRRQRILMSRIMTSNEFVEGTIRNILVGSGEYRANQ